VPDIPQLSDTIIAFIQQLLVRLEGAAPDRPDVKMEVDPSETKAPGIAVVENGVLQSGVPPPDSELHVQQHVELLLALCTKEPDLLDRYVQSRRLACLLDANQAL
jgi:symplekin